MWPSVRAGGLPGTRSSQHPGLRLQPRAVLQGPLEPWSIVPAAMRSFVHSHRRDLRGLGRQALSLAASSGGGVAPSPALCPSVPDSSVGLCLPSAPHGPGTQASPFQLSKLPSLAGQKWCRGAHTGKPGPGRGRVNGSLASLRGWWRFGWSATLCNKNPSVTGLKHSESNKRTSYVFVTHIIGGRLNSSCGWGNGAEGVAGRDASSGEQAGDGGHVPGSPHLLARGGCSTLPAAGRSVSPGRSVGPPN